VIETERQIKQGQYFDSPESSGPIRDFSRPSTVSSPASTTPNTGFGNDVSSHESLLNPLLYNNPLPDAPAYGIQPTTGHQQDYQFYSQNIFLGPQYLEYLHAQHVPQAAAVQGLSLEEQSNLLEFLEEGFRGNKLPSPEYFNSSGW
jgi:hypothetical protein